MKLTKKIVALVAVLMTTASVWASEVTVKTLLNGVESSTVGTVTPRVSESNGVCTLTVTPTSGYYIDVITAEKTVDAGMAQAPRRRTTPGMDNYLQVTAPQSPFDPSGETTWTFTMPASDYNVEVVANFKARTSIDSGALNLTLPEGGFAFDGEAKEPAVTVTLDGSTLASSNYTVDYSNNVNAGTATVTVTGVKTYQGTLTQDFTIGKANLSVVTIADIADQTYTGQAVEPVVNVTFNGESVDADEYTVGYSNNTNVGEATVTLTATGINFTAGTTATKTFQIMKANAVISAENQTVTYNGEEQEFTNYSVDNGSVIVRYYASEEDRAKGSNELEVVVNAGTYYLLLEQGDENYHSDPATALFVIEPKALTEDMMWQEGGEFVYDGEEKTLAAGMFGLTDGEKELVYGVDFTIEYANNINVGTATATIIGLGNYQGTLTTTFEIVRELALHFSERNSWVSYCATEDLTVPERLRAYVVTSVSGSSVQVEEIGFIPAGQGVLLYCEEPADASEGFFAAAYNEAHSELPYNYLQGITTATSVSTLAADGASIYVLYNDEFVKTISGTIPANRSYLPVGRDVNVNARLSISFADDDEITAIETIANSQKLKANGQYYDLQGRKVAQPAKGLYIVDGRKVVFK